MYTKETKIIKWYPKTLPKGAIIDSLPSLTLDEFMNDLHSGEATFYEENERKIYNPCIFNTNDSLFIDIDHIDNYYDIIVSHMEDIIAICPMIILAKQSRGKSLHFICCGHWDTQEEHAVKDMCYLAAIAKTIQNITGIDLRKVDGALDKHTKSSEQRLFVYNPEKHPIWVNPYPTEVDINPEKVFEEYPMLRVNQTNMETEWMGYCGDFYPTIRDNKWTLDKNFNVAGYTGNDARWRVANAVHYLCKGNLNMAKQVIRDNFKNYNEFSFSSVAKGPNSQVLQWVKQNMEDNVGGDVKGWLTEKKDEILQYFEKYHRIEVVAPTGSGKTTLIVGNENIVGLAQELNAVVLCPTNNMMELYSSLKVIHSKPTGGSNLNEYKDDEPCVIIWDQAQKILSRLRNRIVIIDEAHTLYLDRTYRDSAVRMMIALKTFPNLIAVTATPTGEEQELQLRRLEYTMSKGMIFTKWITTNDAIDSLMLGEIMFNEKVGYYDRVVVFSDHYVRRIHENLINRDVKVDHTYIHGENKSGNDFKEVHDKEMLTKRVTLCTKLAFNGLNFKNKGEQVLVLMDVREKDTVAANIIQCVGRMRNAAMVTLKAYTEPEGERSSVEELALKTNLIMDDASQIDGRLVSFDERLSNPDVVAAKQRIEDYMNDFGTLDKIKEDLQNTGYFVIKEVECTKGIEGRLTLVEKRRVEGEWMNMLLTGKAVDEDTIQSPYYKACENMFRRLTWEFAMRPWYIKEYLKRQNEIRNTLPSNTLETLYKKAIIASYDDKEFGSHIRRLQRVEEQLKGPSKKTLHCEIAKLLKWRNDYKNEQGEDWIPCNMVALQNLAMDDLCLHIDEIKEKESKAHSVKHKKHSNTKVYRCEDGFEGTKEEIAKHLNITIDGVKYQIKKGITKAV